MPWDIWTLTKIPGLINWEGQAENLSPDTLANLETTKQAVNF